MAHKLSHTRSHVITSMMLLFSLSFIVPLQTHATSYNPWQDEPQTAQSPQQRSILQRHNSLASDERALRVNHLDLANHLNSSTQQFTLSIPLPTQDMATYRFTYDSVIHPTLAQKFPRLLSFKAVDTQNKSNTGRFTLTPMGLNGVINHNNQRILINPKYVNDRSRYVSYFEKNAQPLTTRTPDIVKVRPSTTAVSNDTTVTTSTADTHAHTASKKAAVTPLRRSITTGKTLITYRIAVATSGEYTDFHYKNSANFALTQKEAALAGIINTLNKVNEVYAREVGVRFKLIADNDKVIFTNAATDPFKNDDDDAELNQKVITDIIGLDNVDIAHVFNTGSGGSAYPGLCDRGFKSRAVTGNPIPTGDTFDYSYVSHELGHQLGANHTFNGLKGSCNSRNRSKDGTWWEPGSGSTIMSYAGICFADNLQKDADSFFHVGSIQEMQSFIGQTSCGKRSVIENNTPTAFAGFSYVIPAYTPFKLSGKGSDADSDDVLTFSWEQQDVGVATSLYRNGTTRDLGSGPLFRSFAPISSPVRYFPRLNDVLNISLSRGEGYPTTNRELNFRFTVRDGKGGVASDGVTLTVKNTGRPFSVVQPKNITKWPAGGKGRVVWDVAGTTEAPVSCPNVDILLDTGDKKFATVLAKNISNDGEAVIDVPNSKTQLARVMLTCSNNVFYAVNNGVFSITDAADASPFDTSPVPNKASSAPPSQPVFPSMPDITDSTPPAPSGSGGGGGGSMPPVFVMLLALAACLSVGCKHMQTAEAVTPLTTPNTTPNQATSPDALPEHIDIDLSVTVDDAVQHALKRGDHRLYTLMGRHPVIAGIAVAERAAAQARCGIVFVSNTSDYIKTEEQGKVRQRLTHYAAAYNRLMYAQCKNVTTEP